MDEFDPSLKGGGAFHFGSCCLNPAKREFCRGGVAVVLTPQVFDCLTYLLTHRERAVGRDELMAAVWGRAEVSDTLLGQTVMHARRAAGDNGAAQHVIRTIPRFGYRWVDDSVRFVPTAPADLAPVPGDRDAEPVAAHESAPQPPPSRTRAIRGVWLTLGGLLALVAVVVFLQSAPVQAPTATEHAAHGEVNRQLVLVTPASAALDRDTAWIPLGIMDAIGGQLRDQGWPVVPSVTAVALGSQAGKPTAWLSAASGAGLVVRPEVQVHAGAWRVLLRLEGREDLPATIDADAVEPLDAARLAGERLLALLQQQPLPELARQDPDFATSRLVQQIEAELLAGQLGAARAALAAAPQALRQRPEVRLQAATLDYRAGELDAAANGYRIFLDQLTPEAPPRWRARALIGLGAVARTRGQFAQAIPWYEQAIASLQGQRQPDLEGFAYASLGINLSGLERFDEAMAALARARLLLESVGDTYRLAQVDSTYAAALADRHRLAEAVPRMRQAIERFAQLGMQADVQGQQLALAQALRELLDHDTAEAVAAEAWQAFAGQPSNRLYPIAAATRIWTLLEVGHIAAARRLVAAVPRTGLDPGYQADRLRLALADLDLRVGQWPAAAAGYADAIERAALPREAGPAWLSRLRVLRVMGRDQELQADLVRAVRQWEGEAAPRRDQRVYLRLIEAEQAIGTNDRQQAWAPYAEALRLAEADGVPALIALVAQSYGRALLADARLDQATAVVGRVAVWAEQDYDCALLQAEFYRAAGDHAAWQRWLDRARVLAGERIVPDWLSAPPVTLR